MFNSITLCFISFLGGGMIGMGTVLFVQDAFYNENKIEEKRNAQFLAYRELCIFVNKYF